MFIVAWEGTPPPDKAEWTEILREVLAGELGSYRVVFRNKGRGWRFELEWRDDGRANGDGEVIANSPDSVAYNIYVNLAGSGKPLDAGWRPWEHAPAPPGAVAAAASLVAAKDVSSSRAARPNRPASGTRKKHGP
jgi:hypothetical protein